MFNLIKVFLLVFYYGFKFKKEIPNNKKELSLKLEKLLNLNFEFTPYQGKTNLFVISNHQSFKDIIILENFLNKINSTDNYFVAKKELKKTFLLKHFFINIKNCIFIDRQNPNSLKTIIKNKNKNSIVIFPEGTRNRTLKPFKESINFLKKQLNKETLLVYIDYELKRIFYKQSIEENIVKEYEDFYNSIKQKNH